MPEEDSAIRESESPNLFIEMVKYILTFAFGFAGGIGYKYVADRKRH